MSTFIAEVKTRSPFGFENPLPEDYLTDIALDHGDWVAIHTHPAWGGSIEKLAEVRRRMVRQKIDKPLVAKGIHMHDGDLRQALSVADFALVVGRWPFGIPEVLWERLIFEPLYEAQIPLALNLRPDVKVMWNARDLTTGGPKFPPLPARLIAARHPIQWLCQASFIDHPSDVAPDLDAHIVGARLVEYLEAQGLG